MCNLDFGDNSRVVPVVPGVLEMQGRSLGDLSRNHRSCDPMKVSQVASGRPILHHIQVPVIAAGYRLILASLIINFIISFLVCNIHSYFPPTMISIDSFGD